jgi:ABC-type sugar transport system permease subunit
VGLTVLLWQARRIDGRSAVAVVVPALVLLLLSHTRTALLGLVVGLAVASLSVVFTNARARRSIAAAATLGVLGAAVFGSVVQEWLSRGQDSDQLSSLTGRQRVWDALLAHDRTFGEQLIGVGLTDKSFDGLAIDSTWLSVYHELGWAGVVLVASMLVGLVFAAALRPPTPGRTCAVFLVTYSIVASYTEVGLGDSSPYLLGLAAAAAALAVPTPTGQRPDTVAAHRDERVGPADARPTTGGSGT